MRSDKALGRQKVEKSTGKGRGAGVFPLKWSCRAGWVGSKKGVGASVEGCIWFHGVGGTGAGFGPGTGGGGGGGNRWLRVV